MYKNYLNLKFIFIAASLMVFAFIGNAMGQSMTFKFSHVVATDTPKGLAAAFFAKRAAELTNNKVKIEVYPNSTLYKDNEEIEALRLGSVNFLAPSLAKFGPLGLSEFEVFDLPYIFDSYESLHTVTKGPVGKELMSRMAKTGLLGLGFWDNGFKSLSANKPIYNPEDVKGLKLRIQSSKVLEEQMRALGGLPQIMAFSEVYNALQTGVVDGTENPMSNFSTQKFYEVQKYLTLSEHGYLGYAVITNKKFWDGLPADIRNALSQAMEEATDYANRIAKEKSDADLKTVRDSGRTEIITLTPAQKQAFIKALSPVHDKMSSRIGKDVIESVYKATGFKK